MKNQFVLSTSIFAVTLFCFTAFPVPVHPQKNLVPLLLEIPAPPEPKNKNRRETTLAITDFYSHLNPPRDDAPIEDILRYWQHWNRKDPIRYFTISPSHTVGERILTEVENDPNILVNYLNILTNVPGAAERVNRLFEDPELRAKIVSYQRSPIQSWLESNSNSNIEQLEAGANTIRDVGGYLSNQYYLLSLARLDWDRAQPIADRLANNPDQPISQTLGRWVLYKRAYDEGNPNEAESYRRLLKETVEDQNAGAGNRDLAFDALVRVGDFAGRDEWYLSLFDDETLHELRVGNSTYTGLTTMINQSPPDKFVDAMIELVKSRNIKIRSAAARNLGLMLADGDPRVIAALVPWLEDPNWAKEYRSELSLLIDALKSTKVPESVPGLLLHLDNLTARIADEIKPEDTNNPRSVETARQSTIDVRNQSYRLRLGVVKAIAGQEDLRAAPALLSLLPLTRKDDRKLLVDAIYRSGGYTSSFQVAALETLAREMAPNIRDKMLAVESRVANFDPLQRFTPITKRTTPSGLKNKEIGLLFGMPQSSGGVGASRAEFIQPEPFDPAEVIPHLTKSISGDDEPAPDFLSALARRIQELQTTDKYTAAALRSFMLRWQGHVLYALLLSDLAAGNADVDATVKLLANRKALREAQIEDIFEVRSSKFSEAKSIGVCLLEDEVLAARILSSQDTPAKSALFACARLIRMNLPLKNSVESLSSEDTFLALSASRYLESVDSPAARQALWASAPDQAWIIGPRHYYGNHPKIPFDAGLVLQLFESVGHSTGIYQGWDFYRNYEDLEIAENIIRGELTEKKELLGIYWYEGTYIKVSEGSYELMWETDPARYRTRQLTSEEYAAFRRLITSAEGLESAPFIGKCNGCGEEQLVMVGREGGRRIFVSTNRPPAFIVDLENLLADLKKTKSDLRYWAEKKIKGLEVVFADERREVVGMTGTGNNRLVLLKDTIRAEEISAEIERLYQKDLYDSDIGYSESAERNRDRKANMPVEAYSWHVLTEDGVGPATNAPQGFNIAEPYVDYQNYEEPNTTATNGTIKLSAIKTGLYITKNSETRILAKGEFHKPLIDTRGSNAIVLSEREESAGMFAVDLMRGTLTLVKLPEGTLFLLPKQYLPQVDKFLAVAGSKPREDRRSLTDGKPYLYDAKTGTLKIVNGDLEPLLEAGDAELQDAGGGKYWAAIKKEGGTSVGVYSLEDFSFVEKIFVPWLSFKSTEMYVNEQGTGALVIYNGQLVRIPFTQPELPVQ